MALLEVSQLDKVGVISDYNPYLLAAEAFTEANNVIFKDGSIQNVKGYTLYPTPFLDAGETLVKVKGIADQLYFFTEKALYLTTQQSYEKIDYPEGFVIGEEFYVNPKSALPVITTNGVPYGIRVTNNKKELFVLDGWGDNMKARCVTAYRGFLFAFGVTIDGNFYQDTIFNSDVSAPDSYPTDWGFELDDKHNINLALPIEGSMGGYNTLSSIGGTLVAAAEFRESIYFFTESEIFRTTEVGGAFIFETKKVLEGSGAVNPDSLTVLENGLLCIGNGDIYLFSGGATQSISNNKVSKFIANKVVQGTDIKMIRDFNEKLVYIFMRSSSRSVNTYTQAMVWNWVNNTFSFLDYAYTQFDDITEYRASSLFDDTNRQCSDMDMKWNAANFSWQSENKYGLGILAIRPNQTLIINRGSNIVDPSGKVKPVNWNFKRVLHTNVFGLDERAIVRIHGITLKGGTNNVQYSINGKQCVLRGDTNYIRETNKTFDIVGFGSGVMNLPAYVIDWSLMGRR